MGAANGEVGDVQEPSVAGEILTLGQKLDKVTWAADSIRAAQKQYEHDVSNLLAELWGLQPNDTIVLTMRGSKWLKSDVATSLAVLMRHCSGQVDYDEAGDVATYRFQRGTIAFGAHYQEGRMAVLEVQAHITDPTYTDPQDRYLRQVPLTTSGIELKES